MLNIDDDLLDYLDNKPSKDFQPEIDAQNKLIDSLKTKIDELASRLDTLPVQQKDEKKPGQAEIYYRADGRIKSFKMGNIGAVIVRDNNGKMRKIDIGEM